MEKNIFVYGTLKQGQRNHYHFEDKVIKIIPGTINACLYHLNDYDCPTIKLEDGVIEGEIIYYDDDDSNSIEQAVDELEQSTPGLYYDRIPVEVKSTNAITMSEVYIVRNFELLNSTKIAKKW